MQAGVTAKLELILLLVVPKPTDHGKRIRKNGDYMRAVNSTSSEWGDPLHARSFLSSTAASLRGSPACLFLIIHNFIKFHVIGQS